MESNQTNTTGAPSYEIKAECMVSQGIKRHAARSAGAADAEYRDCSYLRASRHARWRAHRCTSYIVVPRVLPNPSLKLSPNGVAHRPSSAGPSAHFALAVQRATPSVPA